MVHRLITLGTFEENIDEMLKSKKDLANMAVYEGEKIITELEEGSGKQFDPEIVKVMLELIKNDAFKNMNDELKDN